jgi:ABC-type polysaccharide/polyol phosphate export permease
MLNPMACIVVMYRDVLLYGNMPNPKVMSYALLISFSLLIIGLIIFKRKETIFADLV